MPVKCPKHCDSWDYEISLESLWNHCAFENFIDRKNHEFHKKNLIIPTKICKQYGPHGTGTDQRQFEIVLSISDKVLESDQRHKQKIDKDGYENDIDGPHWAFLCFPHPFRKTINPQVILE